MLLTKYIKTALLASLIMFFVGCGGSSSSEAKKTINLPPTISGPLSYSYNTTESPYFLFQSDLLIGAKDPENQTLVVSNLKIQSGNGIGITSQTDPFTISIEPFKYDNLLKLGESEDVVFDYTIIDGDGGSIDTSITITFNGVKDHRRLDSLVFTDPKFQACFNDQYTSEELTFVYQFTTLKCEKIDSVQGIENLVDLRDLIITAGKLTSVDLSSNKQLGYLDLSDNELTDIDLHHNTKLMQLDLKNNNLTSINLESNIQLNYLQLNENQLSEIDIVNNINLTSLNISSNHLVNIDISSNTKLFQLDVSLNQLTSLDVSDHNELEIIIANYNFLNHIDLQKNSMLNFLNISNNRLTMIDLSANSELKDLILNANSLSTLNLATNSNLEFVNVEFNKITELELNNNSSLTELWLTNNLLSTINIDNNNSLKKLRITNNPLTQGAKDYLKEVKTTGVDIYY